jgi:predicted transcriptional regulator
MKMNIGTFTMTNYKINQQEKEGLFGKSSNCNSSSVVQADMQNYPSTLTSARGNFQKIDGNS